MADGAVAPVLRPTEIIVKAMTAATSLPWDAAESQAYWGRAVLRAS
jgi:hypothetical protein